MCVGRENRNKISSDTKQLDTQSAAIHRRRPKTKQKYMHNRYTPQIYQNYGFLQYLVRGQAHIVFRIESHLFSWNTCTNILLIRNNIALYAFANIQFNTNSYAVTNRHLVDNLLNKTISKNSKHFHMYVQSMVFFEMHTYLTEMPSINCRTILSYILGNKPNENRSHILQIVRFQSFSLKSAQEIEIIVIQFQAF